MNPFLLASLPLTGVLLGAFLQSFLQLRRERVTQKQTLKVKAYTDFLQAAAALSSSNVANHPEARTLLTDARLRILIYGNSEVIKNIAAFDRTGSGLMTPGSKKAFLPIISSMREGDRKVKISEQDMARVLFGQDSFE